MRGQATISAFLCGPVSEARDSDEARNDDSVLRFPANFFPRRSPNSGSSRRTTVAPSRRTTVAPSL